MLNLKTTAELDQFESWMGAFINDRSNANAVNKYLSEAIDGLSDHPQSAKLQAAFIDLYITANFLKIDLYDLGDTWNSVSRRFGFRPEDPIPPTVLEDFEAFKLKMSTLKGTWETVVRLRAFWDKYLGFLVLFLDPDNYDRYVGARSRRKAFRKIANDWKEIPYPIQHAMVTSRFQTVPEYHLVVNQLESHGIFPEPFIPVLFNLIEKIDYYRTPEVHGTGKLRTGSLINNSLLIAPELHMVVEQSNLVMHMFGGLKNSLIQNPDMLDLRTTPRYMRPWEFHSDVWTKPAGS